MSCTDALLKSWVCLRISKSSQFSVFTSEVFDFMRSSIENGVGDFTDSVLIGCDVVNVTLLAGSVLISMVITLGRDDDVDVMTLLRWALILCSGG